jgi:adenylate cyclase
VLLFVAHAIEKYPTRDGRLPFIAKLDHFIYDLRLRLTMPGGVDAGVVILDIDEASLAEIGHWPWSRALMAELVAKLFDRYGIAVLGFDVVWAERDRSSGIDTLDALAQTDFKQVSGFQDAYKSVRPRLDNDGLFAKAMQGRPVVLGYYFNQQSREVQGNAIPEPVLPKGSFDGLDARFMAWSGYTGNLPGYVANAAAAGHFNPLVDEDGVVRRVPLLAEFEGAYYESLALAVVRTDLALRSNAGRPGVAPLHRRIQVGPLAIPVDEGGAVLVPYRGRQGSFPYLRLADVVMDRVDAAQLKSKIVLVGTTAPGLHDLRPAPVGGSYPGVEIHANLVAGMLAGTIKEQPSAGGAELLVIVLAGIALGVIIPMLSPLSASLATAAGLVLIVAANLFAWSHADMALPLAAAVLMCVILYGFNMTYGYFVESHSRRQFTKLFGQYVPPELVDRMAANPARYNMEPRSAELSILFADVRGFAGISEALKPDELREYINAYLTDMSTIIRSRYRGTLDKYMGDAIMAFWGAPVDDAEHARHGVLAALDMQKECEVLNAKFAARGWPPLRIGVGVNSGAVRVGDMGSRLRRAYTAMGDAVNVASRLERRTKAYAVGILVGEPTRRSVRDVVFREIDRIRVKGKDEAITIYEPLGLQSQIGQQALDELELWNSTLRAYRRQQWDQAEIDLEDLVRMNPTCSLYRAYAGRLAEKRCNPPPPEWDGVSAFEEK